MSVGTVVNETQFELEIAELPGQRKSGVEVDILAEDVLGAVLKMSLDSLTCFEFCEEGSTLGESEPKPGFIVDVWSSFSFLDVRLYFDSSSHTCQVDIQSSYRIVHEVLVYEIVRHVEARSPVDNRRSGRKRCIFVGFFDGVPNFSFWHDILIQIRRQSPTYLLKIYH